MENKARNAVREFYERTAEDYDREYQVPYWQLYHEITWNNVRKFLPEERNAVVLDAGGGTGYWAIRLAKHGFRVVLTDISENMLKVAQGKIRKEKLLDRIETRIVDIRDMSCFRANHFDMALVEGDPLSYCLDPERAVKELVRVVKPNAHVIVSVDSKYSIIYRLVAEGSFDEVSEFLRTSTLKREFEYQAFTPEELEALLKKCGLEFIRVIGKPIFSQFIQREKRDEIIKKKFEKILDLELRFCDTPSLVGMGGHLEAVGKKPRTHKKKRVS